MHVFILIKFTETSIDKTNKIHQKVIGSKFMFKMSAVHTNTCINRCHDDGVVQQPPLPQQTFLQLIHIMDLRTVDPVLKDTVPQTL